MVSLTIVKFATSSGLQQDRHAEHQPLVQPNSAGLFLAR